MQLLILDRKGMGEDLRRAREHLRLTLAEVAIAADVAASHVWNLENGNRDVSLERFTSVCMALGLPTSLLLCENVSVDRELLFSRVVQNSKVSKQSDKNALAMALFTADYAAGCSVILCNAIATGFFNPARWTFPTKGIGDAIGTVLMRLKVDESLAGRWEHIRRFSTDPVEANSRFGLMTPKLFTEFISTKTPGNIVHWLPQPSKNFEGLFRDSHNLMAQFDPQSFGQTIREINEATSEAQMEAALVYLKRKKDLPSEADSLTNGDVKPVLPKLIDRLNRATQARGSKSELAAWLGVHRQSVTDWLSGKQEPGGEITLQLLKWVEQQERQK